MRGERSMLKKETNEEGKWRRDKRTSRVSGSMMTSQRDEIVDGRRGQQIK